MAIKALDPCAPFWFAPDGQAEGDPVTRFRIRGLTGAQVGHVAPEFIRDQTGNPTNLTGRGIELALSYGLLDWEHFEDSKGPLKFNRAHFDRIPYEVRAILALEIIVASQQTDEQKKTS